MAYDLPIYKAIMSDEDDFIDFNSVVDFPAHSKPFHLFDKSKKKVYQTFNDEKMIVTGVAIATDVPIFRRDENGREFYMYFTEDETKKFAERLFERGYMNNLNEMHDSNKITTGMKIIESYFVHDVNHPAPEIFKEQNLKNGSWIVSYKVNDPELWSRLRSGQYAGFSVEGWFSLQRMRFNNQNKNKMSNKKEGFFAKIKAMMETEEKQEKFGQAVTTEGATIVWDGEEMLAVGQELRIRAEEGEEEILAPEGIMTVLADDGSSMIITVDPNGIVTEIEIAEAEGEMEQAIEEMAKEIQSLKSENEDLHKAKEHINDEFQTFKLETEEKIETLSAFMTKDKKENGKEKQSKTWRDFTKN